jgi:iron complex outermembrane receptor protein
LSPIAAGCAALVFSSGTVYAQAAADQNLETVVVTGIRKGIEDAISIKKGSDSIVEAVSAEDIGKLPDTTVAESISRLPGVTASRSRITGQANQISVRGMSPDFNGGLLNGREQASTAGGRGVEFDAFPAELLGGIVIYKTPDSTLIGQGLSSTIDMQTVRPLNFSKRTVALNARHEELKAADTGEGYTKGKGDRYSLSYIDQFADRTIGVVLGYTHSKDGGNGRPNFNSWGGWAADVPYNGVNVKTPGGFTTDIETVYSDRDATLATLQFKPNKNFESNIDVLHSQGKFKVIKTGLEGPLGGLSAGANDPGGTLINATVVGGVATSGTFTDWKGVIRNHREAYTDTSNSIGWANKLVANDWTIKSDVSFSHVVRQSERFETTAGLPGNARGAFANPNDTISYTGFDGSNFGNVHYTTGLNYADPSIIKLTDVQGWAGSTGIQDGYYAAPKNDDIIHALRLSGKTGVELGPINSVETGANYTIRRKNHTTREGALLLNNYLAAGRYVSADVPNPSVGVGGATGIPVVKWDSTGSLGPVYTLNPWSDHDVVSKNWGVKEKVMTEYVKGDLDGQIGGISYRGNIGTQLVQTDQSATGFKIEQATCNGGTHTCGYSSVNGGTTYNDFVPSMNLIGDLGGDNIVRLGLGRVLARANMDDMKSTVDFSYDSTKQLLKGSGGNPNLSPFRANAVDVSYEKYFGKKGYVSIAGFYKDLKSYILKRDVATDFSSYITSASGIPGGVSTVGLLTKPVNGSGGTIKGVEVSVNVPFSLATSMLDGFGVMMNYSNTSSSVSLPASGFSTADTGTTNIPLPGLSKQVTNLRAYFEKHGFQIAVAQRTRSDYLGSISDFQDNTQLVYIKGASTVDVQLSYEFAWGYLKGLSLLAQANNVTNPKYVEYNASTKSVNVEKKFGSSYMVGANYKF